MGVIWDILENRKRICQISIVEALRAAILHGVTRGGAGAAFGEPAMERNRPSEGPSGGELTMMIRRAALAALLLGVSAVAVQAEMVAPTTPPDAPKFDAQGEPVFVNRADIYEFKALPAYNEPAWVKAFVAAGKLPPVAERLPKEPMVYKTANEPDGIGVYGDVMRHVIGGRPGRLELLGRPVLWLGRHRHRSGGMSDPHRPAVRGERGRPAADAEPCQVLGMVRRRQDADRAPDRGRQVVGRRAVQHRRHRVLLERRRHGPGSHAR